MINAILTERGVLRVPGIPEYYLSNRDFRVLMNDIELAKQVRFLWGRDIRIGVFGVLNEDDVWTEESNLDEKTNEISQCDERGLSFYAKLPNDLSKIV